MKLSQAQKDMIKLIQRSPLDEDGWRAVSEMCCTFFRPNAPHKPPSEFFEFEKLETGGRVRLTETAETVLPYI